MKAIHVGERLARAALQLLQGYGRRWVVTSAGSVHALERTGRGPLPPLVLLHGLSSAGTHYVRVTRHLKAFSRVVLPDMLGHGFSEMPTPLDGTTLLAGLYESLDALIDQPCILAGTSLGGYTAIRYALTRPQKVAGLVIAAPAGALMNEHEIAALKRRFRLETHDEALAFADALFAKRPWLMRHLLAMGLRDQFSLPQTLAVLEELRVPRLLSAAELQSLKMPTLFLWGASERILPVANLEYFQAHLPPHARFEYPVGWGHSGFLDDPKGFAARLVAFGAQLAGLSAAQTARL